MARWLSEQSESKMLYNLSAVLIHKGSAVNIGHYVAHIKDQDTGLWWEFDDELVSELGQHPFGGGSFNTSTKPVQPVPGGQSSSAEPNSVVNGNHMGASSSETNTHVGTFSSTDAYMLMYSLRNQTNGDRKPQMVSGEQKLNDDAYLPPHLLKQVIELNKTYVDSCQQYKIKKDAKF
ncbi:putative ubiquitinyl hydrolase 1 [Helianthus annuus]|nr:putative ubiquitinyl hydrolase 1 [Helianthus annuus]